MPKVMSAEEAVRTYIHDGATVAFGGFVGAMVPEEVNKTIQELYLSSCSPKGSPLFTPPARATRVSGGLNHLGEEGLLSRIIGGHWGLVPRLQKLAMENKAAAYNYPRGAVPALPGHRRRQAGAHHPRRSEDLLWTRRWRAACSTTRLVRLVPWWSASRSAGETRLLYKALPIDVAVIRATYADTQGNCTFQREGRQRRDPSHRPSRQELRRQSHRPGGGRGGVRRSGHPSGAAPRHLCGCHRCSRPGKPHADLWYRLATPPTAARCGCR